MPREEAMYMYIDINFKIVAIILFTYITKTRLFKYTEHFTTKKTESFPIKLLIFFIFQLKNIDCGYSLEPPPQ